MVQGRVTLLGCANDAGVSELTNIHVYLYIHGQAGISTV